MDEGALTYWTQVLTGIEPERVLAARQEVARWGFEHCERELLQADLDAAVACTLLVEGIDNFVDHGVPRERLLKKLRQDREVWGTWAEVRAADILLRSAYPDAELRLEEGKSKGAHADLRFLFPDDEFATSVEVKAVGLSDEEAAFYGRQGPVLERLLPPVGLAHGHANIEAAAARPLNREQRREGARAARQAMKQVPRYPRGLRGAIVVGHGSEESYARRAARRVAQAARQLPPSDRCLVAIYWSNGARVESVREAIPWSEIPEHVVGFLLVGCAVALPHRDIHCFVMGLPRGAPADAGTEIRSEHPEMEELAGLVLNRLDDSSAVRPTLLVGGKHRLLYRDGRRRILPFHLLMDADPRPVGRPGRGPVRP